MTATAVSRHRHWWLAVLVAFLVVTGAALGYFWWESGDPRFAFPNMANRKDADELRRLTAFARQLRTQRARLAANPDSAPEGGADPYAALVQVRSAEQLLDLVNGATFPSKTSWARQVGCSLYGKPTTDPALWVDAFLRDYDEHLAPVQAFYDAIDAITSATTPGNHGLQFVLRRSSTATPMRYERFDTQADWDIWLGQPGAEGTTLEQPLGVMLLNHPWHRASEQPRPDWPPNADNLRTQEDPCTRFLRGQQLPGGLKARKPRFVAAGTWERPVGTLSFDLAAADFPGWSSPGQLPIVGGAPVAELRQAVKKLGTEARPSLEQHLLALTEWRELPVKITPGSGTLPLRVCFALPNLPPVDLGARLNEDCRLIVDGLPDLATRLQLAEQVARAEPKLEPYRGRLQLARLQVGQPAGALQLEFRLVDPKQPTSAVEGIRWEVAADGKGSVRLPPGFQERVGKVTPIPAPDPHAPPPDPRARLEHTAQRHLSTAYGKLGRAVNVAFEASPAGGHLLSLGLKIADLDELQLGPLPVHHVDRVTEAIDQLLGQEMVARQAEVAWASRNPSGSGHRQSLKNWEPLQSLATLAHTLVLNQGVELAWEEKISGTAGWLRETEAQVNERLFSQFSALLGGGQGDTLRLNLGEAIVGLAPSRERFGDGRWLRLSPPAVALRVDFEHALTGIVAGTDVVLDERGWTWTLEPFAFGFQGTITFAKFAVSDPKVTIWPHERKAKVEAKVTPPVPGKLKCAEPGRLSKVGKGCKRLDSTVRNPWLGLAYVYVEAEGRLSGPEMRGSAQVKFGEAFLGSGRGLVVARGDVLGDFGTLEFGCNLKAGHALPGLQWLPLGMDGMAYLQGQVGKFSASVRGESLGNGFGGCLDFQLVDDQPHLKVAGLLVVGQLQLGVSGDVPGCRDYTLHGHTQLDFQVGRALVRVEIDPREVRWYRQWDWGREEKVYSQPSLQVVDPEELYRRISDAGSGRGGGGSGGSGSGGSVARSNGPLLAAPDLGSWGARPEGAPDIPGRPSLTPPQQVGDTIPAFLPNGDFGIKRGSNILLQLPVRDLGIDFSGVCRHVVWARPDSPERDLLSLAPTGPRRIVHVHFPARGAVRIANLTATYEKYLPDLFDAHPGRGGAARDAVYSHFEKSTFAEHQAVPEAVQVTPHGYRLDYRKKGLSHTLFCWWSARSNHRAQLLAPALAPEQRTPKLFQSLARLGNKAGHNMIVAAHNEADDRLAWLAHSNGAWTLTLQGSKATAVPLHLPAGGDPRRFLGTRALATAWWAHKEAPDPKAVWVGPQGACAQVGDGWLLVRQAEEQPRLLHLKRERFDRWENEVSLKLLPTSWQQLAQRRELSPAAVAQVVVEDYARLRNQRPEWQEANPLGLLQELARAKAP